MKKNKFIYSVILLFFVLFVVSVSCQQQDDLNNFHDHENYLSLPSNVDYNQLTSADLKILFEAFARLKIKENEDGLLEIVQSCGRDINISEDLFNYFLSIKEKSNESILSTISFNRKRVQTRQEGGGTASMTDCVARSIVYATGMNYDDVNSWITSTYGSNGVPYDQFYSVMNHFNNGAQVPYYMFKDMTITQSKKYIIVLGLSHAVTVEYKSGENIIYWDAQTNERKFCTVSGVTQIYELR